MTENAAKSDKPNTFAMPYVIVWAPAPTREYGEPEVTGPFATPEDAQDYLDHELAVADWTAAIVKLDLAPPFDDEGIRITAGAD